MDKNGNEVIPAKYSAVRNFSDGLAAVWVGSLSNGKFGFIDKTGKEVIAPKYDLAYEFSEGLAVVNNGYTQDRNTYEIKGGKWGFVGILETAPASDELVLDTASTWAVEGLKSAASKGFVPSDLQGKYTEVITRAEFCRLAVKWLEYKTDKSIDALLAEKNVSRTPGIFSDTSDPDILAAYALGITSGTGNGQFSPNGSFTREQAAGMIRNVCRATGMDVSNVKSASFSDANTMSTWAVDGINFCYNTKVMTGTNISPLTFSPKMNYTREQSILTFDNIK